MSLNVVALSGNLGRDAELKAGRGGTAVLTFPLAVNKRVRQADGSWGDHCNWVDCVVFGRRAEGLARWLRRGSKVAVLGELHYSSWEHDGARRSKLEVHVEEVELMGGGGPKAGAEGPAGQGAPAGWPEASEGDVEPW